MSDTDAKDTSKPSTDAKEPAKGPETAEIAPKSAEIDEIAPETAEIAPETAKSTPKEPRKGVYTLVQGDTPGIVSIKFYGRSHKANELVKANPGHDWQPGDVITLV